MQAGELLSEKVQLVSFVSGEKEETWEALRTWGQEGSFLCSLSYLGIASLLSVCCSHQRGGQSYLNRSFARTIIIQEPQSSLIASKVRIKSRDRSASCRSCGQAALLSQLGTG